VKRFTRFPILASFALALAGSSIAFALPPLVNNDVSQTGVLIGGGGGGGGQDPGPDDPFSKPRIPAQPTRIEAKESTIRLQWQDRSSYEQGYVLYRGPAYSGPWTQVASFGAVSGNSAFTQYTDAGLPRDTGYYYRVGAYNSYGESFSLPQAFATIDGRKVSRLRLRIRTANVSDADTDDDVHMSLRDYDNGGTWLDYGRDDFERGDQFTYELSLDDLFDGIQDLSEINHIYLFKPGDDGWCIESVTLIADTLNGVDNGVELFSQHFGSTSSTCRWLDGSQNYLVIGRPTLRAHTAWQTFQKPAPPLSLPRGDLQRRIEGMVGDIIHDGTYVDLFPIYMGTLGVSWTGDALDGESHVAITRKDNERVHVTFNLDVDTPGPGGLTGGLSFDLRFTGQCRTATTPARVSLTMESVQASADFDWITEAITLWLINFAEGGVADTLRDSLPSFSQEIVVDNQSVSCVTPVVASDGSVDFALTFAPRTGGTRTLADAVVGATMGTLSPASPVVVGTKVTTFESIATRTAVAR
jgi:hypothetical protein